MRAMHQIVFATVVIVAAGVTLGGGIEACSAVITFKYDTDVCRFLLFLIIEVHDVTRLKIALAEVICYSDVNRWEMRLEGWPNASALIICIRAVLHKVDLKG